MKLQIIYLAAGNSHRFRKSITNSPEKGKNLPESVKKNKLLYKINGKPMYLHLLGHLASICERHPFWRITVITQYEEIHQTLSQEAKLLFSSPQKILSEGLKLNTIYYPDSKKGISYSIQAGINASPSDTEAYAFFVADQPYLTEKTAENFLTFMEKAQASLGSIRCQNTPGNPTWFSRNYKHELLNLSADTGGRSILRKHAEEIIYYDIPDSKELTDIDILAQTAKKTHPKSRPL